MRLQYADFFEYFVGDIKDHATLRRRNDAPVTDDNQGNPQFSFELLDLMVQSWLTNKEPLSGACVAPKPAGLGECFELREIHRNAGCGRTPNSRRRVAD